MLRLSVHIRAAPDQTCGLFDGMGLMKTGGTVGIPCPRAVIGFFGEKEYTPMANQYHQGVNQSIAEKNE